MTMENQEIGYHRRRAMAAVVTADVRATLGRFALADVRAVRSTVDGNRVRVEVEMRGWHRLAEVLTAVRQTPNLEDVSTDGRGVVWGYRNLEAQR